MITEYISWWQYFRPNGIDNESRILFDKRFSREEAELIGPQIIEECKKSREGVVYQNVEIKFKKNKFYILIDKSGNVFLRERQNL